MFNKNFNKQKSFAVNFSGNENILAVIGKFTIEKIRSYINKLNSISRLKKLPKTTIFENDRQASDLKNACSDNVRV